MPITPKDNFQPRELIPAKTYPARLYQIIEIGTDSYEWNGKMQTPYKVRLTWELPTLTKVFKEGEEPKPLVISEEYTLSMNEKSNLRPIVEGMLGVRLYDEEARAFDLEKLLGKECLLTVVHETNKKGNTYETVHSVSTVPDGMTVPVQINETKVLSFNDWNQELFESLPEFLRTKIQKTPEYQSTIALGKNGESKVSKAEDINPNDIPF